MSEINASFVRNVYVMYIKYTSDLYNLELTPNKNRVEMQKAKFSKELYTFLFYRHVFICRTWQCSRINPYSY